jgi:hypothetical protein
MKEFRLFSNIIKAKINAMGVRLEDKVNCKRKLLKKSQFLARWDERSIKIEND